jgi:2-keto-myo-inositol isomerase
MNSDLVNDLRLADKYGFEYIEFRLDKIEEYLRSHSIQDLIKKLEILTVKPHALNAIKNINMMSAAQTLETEKRLEWACAMGQQLRSPCIVLVPTMDDQLCNNYSREMIFEDCIAVLQRFASVAEVYQVGVALEPVGSKNSAIRNVEDAWAIIDTVDRHNIGLVLDTFNMFMFDGCRDLSSLAKINPEKIFVVHVADSEDLPISTLGQNNRVWPGDGVVPIGKIISILQDIGYEGVISIELFREEYWKMEPDLVVKKSKAIIERVVPGWRS